MKTKRSWSWALLGGVTVLAALQGCSDDDSGNDKPPPTVKPTGGSGGTGNQAGSDAQGGSPDGGGKKSTGGTGNTGNIAGTGGEPAGGSGGAPPEPACDLPELGEDGCYNCPVKGQFEQWVNRCLETDCVPFDNTRVTQIGDDGKLPALPN
jgi:hypothetical protein